MRGSGTPLCVLVFSKYTRGVGADLRRWRSPATREVCFLCWRGRQWVVGDSVVACWGSIGQLPVRPRVDKIEFLCLRLRR